MGVEPGTAALSGGLRHGEPVGFPYIMGANVLIGLSKNKRREHRVGLEPTSPHYECGVLAAERPVPVSKWDQRDSNSHYQSDMLPLQHRAEIGVARIELRCLVLPTHAGHHYPSPRPRGLRPEA